MSEEKKMTLRDTIQPKSDQLNYDDLVAGPITVKVTGLKMGSPEQPVIVKIANAANDTPMRDYKPCKSMRRAMVTVWGDSGKDWVGQSMMLYGDPKVKWAGQEIGGIRISHMTGIDKPTKMLITESRGKRAEYTFQPIK